MAQIRSKPFGVTKQGANVTEYILSNPGGLTVSVLDYGCIIKNIIVPAKNGPVDVVLGHDTMADYEDDFTSSSSTCCGAFVGRYANRIENAVFTVGGKTYQLEANNGPNHLHGCFSRKLYRVKSFGDTLLMEAESPDGEDGFPGNLKIAVRYTLTEDNAFRMDYRVSSDADTIVNLTNHSYFNLTGCKAPVLSHIYMIRADSITLADSIGIPTGELMSVTGTEYDYTSALSAEMRIKKMGKGYDINYKLNKSSDSPELAAIVVEPISGRVLKAYTTEPGMQFYIPNSNMDYLTGHGGRIYGEYYGFCLEMQHFPNSPNIPQFPTTSLFPGDTYRQTTVYKFETLSE